MLRPLPVLLLSVVASLLVGCSAESRKAAELRELDAVGAMRRSVDLQREAMAALDTAQDEETTRAAAERVDFVAFQLEVIAAHLREIGPPTLSQQMEVLGGSLGDLMLDGLKTAGVALRLAGKPSLLAILEPANTRYEAAVDDLGEALKGS